MGMPDRYMFSGKDQDPPPAYSVGQEVRHADPY
jgi:hypothetical protein